MAVFYAICCLIFSAGNDFLFKLFARKKRSRGIFAAADHYFDGRYWILLPLLPLLACVGALYLGAAGMLVCWIRHVRRDWYWILLFLAFAEYYFFLPGPITVPRYQLPALPMLAAMAGEFFRRAAACGCFQRFYARRGSR